MHRAVVPDPEERRIMGEIVRIRDTHHYSWQEISDYVSRWINTKGDIINRSLHRWSRDRCQRAYSVEIAIREREKNEGMTGSTTLLPSRMPPQIREEQINNTIPHGFLVS